MLSDVSKNKLTKKIADLRQLMRERIGRDRGFAIVMDEN